MTTESFFRNRPATFTNVIAAIKAGYSNDCNASLRDQHNFQQIRHTIHTCASSVHASSTQPLAKFLLCEYTAQQDTINGKKFILAVHATTRMQDFLTNADWCTDRTSRLTGTFPPNVLDAALEADEICNRLIHNIVAHNWTLTITGHSVSGCVGLLVTAFILADPRIVAAQKRGAVEFIGFGVPAFTDIDFGKFIAQNALSEHFHFCIHENDIMLTIMNACLGYACTHPPKVTFEETELTERFVQSVLRNDASVMADGLDLLGFIRLRFSKLHFDRQYFGSIVNTYGAKVCEKALFSKIMNLLRDYTAPSLLDEGTIDMYALKIAEAFDISALGSAAQEPAPPMDYVDDFRLFDIYPLNNEEFAVQIFKHKDCRDVVVTFRRPYHITTAFVNFNGIRAEMRAELSQLENMPKCVLLFRAPNGHFLSSNNNAEPAMYQVQIELVSNFNAIHSNVISIPAFDQTRVHTTNFTLRELRFNEMPADLLYMTAAAYVALIRSNEACAPTSFGAHARTIEHILRETDSLLGVPVIELDKTITHQGVLQKRFESLFRLTGILAPSTTLKIRFHEYFKGLETSFGARADDFMNFIPYLLPTSYKIQKLHEKFVAKVHAANNNPNGVLDYPRQCMYTVYNERQILREVSTTLDAADAPIRDSIQRAQELRKLLGNEKAGIIFDICGDAGPLMNIALKNICSIPVDPSKYRSRSKLSVTYLAELEALAVNFKIGNMPFHDLAKYLLLLGTLPSYSIVVQARPPLEYAPLDPTFAYHAAIQQIIGARNEFALDGRNTPYSILANFDSEEATASEDFKRQVFEAIQKLHVN